MGIYFKFFLFQNSAQNALGAPERVKLHVKAFKTWAFGHTSEFQNTNRYPETSKRWAPIPSTVLWYRMAWYNNYVIVHDFLRRIWISLYYQLIEPTRTCQIACQNPKFLGGDTPKPPSRLRYSPIVFGPPIQPSTLHPNFIIKQLILKGPHPH